MTHKKSLKCQYMYNHNKNTLKFCKERKLKLVITLLVILNLVEPRGKAATPNDLSRVAESAYT